MNTLHSDILHYSEEVQDALTQEWWVKILDYKLNKKLSLKLGPDWGKQNKTRWP